jgi:NAD-dependent SIR2 family protein deacetylase
MSSSSSLQQVRRRSPRTTTVHSTIASEQLAEQQQQEKKKTEETMMENPERKCGESCESSLLLLFSSDHDRTNCNDRSDVSKKRETRVSTARNAVPTSQQPPPQQRRRSTRFMTTTMSTTTMQEATTKNKRQRIVKVEKEGTESTRKTSCTTSTTRRQLPQRQSSRTRRCCSYRNKQQPSPPPIMAVALVPSQAQQQQQQLQRRSSVRCRTMEQSITALAQTICCRNEQNNVLFITGAGLSVDSGIRPFRSCTSSFSSSSSNHRTTTHLNQNSHRSYDNNSNTIGIWDEVIWTTATRAAFQKDPIRWYTQFWNLYFDNDTTMMTTTMNPKQERGTSSSSSSVAGVVPQPKTYLPNIGHYAMDCLLQEFPKNVKQVTQNIDGLQQSQQCTVANPNPNLMKNRKNSKQRELQLIEVHGRCGLYKCCPTYDEEKENNDRNESNVNDDDEEEDEEEDPIHKNRPVILGSRRRSQQLQENRTNQCPYRYHQSLTRNEVVYRNVVTSPSTRHARTCRTSKNNTTTTTNDTIKEEEVEDTVVTMPTCPHCSNIVMPQALLFDEQYHDHTYYRYDIVEEWIQAANCIVLVGTSCSVQLTTIALKYAHQYGIPIYNFNLNTLASTSSVQMVQPTKQRETNNTSTTGTTATISNILGPTSETLPLLLAKCRSIRAAVPIEGSKS